MNSHNENDDNGIYLYRLVDMEALRWVFDYKPRPCVLVRMTTTMSETCHMTTSTETTLTFMAMEQRHIRYVVQIHTVMKGTPCWYSTSCILLRHDDTLGRTYVAKLASKSLNARAASKLCARAAVLAFWLTQGSRVYKKTSSTRTSSYHTHCVYGTQLIPPQILASLPGYV